VSRETHDGKIAYFTTPLWLFLALGLAALLNAVLWLSIGLAVALQIIVGAVL
jgi:hypothetical protein